MVKLHYWTGISGILIFLATGLFMHFGLNKFQGMDDVSHLAYRAGHIYILMAALLNLLIGIFAPSSFFTGASAMRWLDKGASLLLFISLPLCIYSFFFEAGMGEVERPMGGFAIIFMFAACIAFLISSALKTETP